MISRFSEFSYGFALTNEMVGLANLQIAPIFPSLIEEGKRGVGYDVKLDAPGIPLFLQFKRSECMLRGYAREKQIADAFGLPLAVPFHRFPITPRLESSQHLSLVELDTWPNRVFYVAPRFHKVEHLDDAWVSQNVAANSIFVKPRSIGPIYDNDRHTVVYNRTQTFFFSEPKPIEAFSLGDIAEQLRSALDDEQRPVRERVDEWVDLVLRAPKEAERKNREAREKASGDRLDISSTAITYQSVVAMSVDGASSAPEAIKDARLPAMRGPKPLEPERELLIKIGDQARMNFEAQFFVAQKLD